ncbi:MAG: hypothetical protein JO077_06265 [Verrucomicrobia bacterium]|nr:hypothetical protein [Verrucomicrobiota bacterium]
MIHICERVRISLHATQTVAARLLGVSLAKRSAAQADAHAIEDCLKAGGSDAHVRRVSEDTFGFR